MPYKDAVVAKQYSKAHGASRYVRAVADGVCVNCKKEPPKPSGKRCERCAVMHVKITRARAVKLRENGICLRCMGPSRPNRNACAECASEVVKGNRAKREDAWAKVFSHYGHQCACCGEAERAFLSVDHINNDGWKHRKEIGGSGQTLRWLIKNNFPPGFQILCMNCNFAKGRKDGDGTCPHERIRREREKVAA